MSRFGRAAKELLDNCSDTRSLKSALESIFNGLENPKEFTDGILGPVVEKKKSAAPVKSTTSPQPTETMKRSVSESG